MDYFLPQIELGREIVLDEPDAFYLHVITVCPRTNFRAGSHQFDNSDLGNGIFKVTLTLEQDPTMLDLAFDTPVVFTLELGSIPFPDEEGIVSVDVIIPDTLTGGAANRTESDPPPPTKTSGSASSSQAKDNPKPIPPDIH